MLVYQIVIQKNDVYLKMIPNPCRLHNTTSPGKNPLLVFQLTMKLTESQFRLLFLGFYLCFLAINPSKSRVHLVKQIWMKLIE